MAQSFKTFFVLICNSTENKIGHAYIYFKMPTIVGILTSISIMNTTSKSLKI